MLRTELVKSLPSQVPLLILLKRWEELVEKEIERKLSLLQELEILLLTRFLK
jgi:hypothetical protein